MKTSTRSDNQLNPTSDCREAGERLSARNLNTGHIGAAGLQCCEAVVVVGGRIHVDIGVGVQLRLVKGSSADG